MDKILFLDIDGVLNHDKFYEDRWKNQHLENNTIHDRLTDEIDIESIKKLNKIVRETGCEIVISSTWRLGQTIEEIADIFSSAGFRYKSLIRDKTPNGLKLTHKGITKTFIPRGLEIYTYLDDRYQCGSTPENHCKFVILDDDSDFLYWHKDNFIHVNRKIGLSDEDVEKCLNIFK
jgi:hypothetical protein